VSGVRGRRVPWPVRLPVEPVLPGAQSLEQVLRPAALSIETPDALRSLFHGHVITGSVAIGVPRTFQRDSAS
jgi:hypothetical protein